MPSWRPLSIMSINSGIAASRLILVVCSGCSRLTNACQGGEHSPDLADVAADPDAAILADELQLEVLRRVLRDVYERSDAVLEMDVGATSGIGGRVPAAGAGVPGSVVAKIVVEVAHDPSRIRIGEEAEEIDQMGPVAEQHRPWSAKSGEDESQLANFAGAYQLAGLLLYSGSQRRL